MENWTQAQREDFSSFENLVKLRQQNYNDYGIVIANKVRFNSMLGNLIKFGLIALGAFLTIKGFEEEFLGKSDIATRNMMLLSYKIIGVLVMILAGSDTLFKFSEKAAGLRVLAAQVKSNIRTNMAKHHFSYNNQNFEEAMQALKAIIEDQDNQLKDIEEKASAIGVDLASSVQIDYSIASKFNK